MTGHSLQSPAEMKQNGFKPASGTPPLTKDEGDVAVDVLYSKNLAKFPKVERKYADPSEHGQKYALVSFVPSNGAKPDEDGVYGMMKVRGVYGNIDEADDRAEFLVRNVDSYQNILTTYVGRPFPLVETGEKFGAELKEIDLEKKVEEVVKKDMKGKRAEERKVVKEIQEKEEALREDVATEAEDLSPEETYTMMRVKRSQLLYTFAETKKKMLEMKDNIIKCTTEIEKMDVEEPHHKDEYAERYNAARGEAGLSNFQDDESFVKYMGLDVDLEELWQF